MEGIALATRVHPAITSYLDVEKDDFYHIETTLDGKQFVTARGWDDLSRVMRAYESRGIPVTECLIAQYVQDPRTSKRFAMYCDLFKKYRADYRVDAILAGEAPGAVFERAKAAAFDERLALVGLLVSAISVQLHQVMLLDSSVAAAYEELRDISRCCDAGEQDESDVRAACGAAALRLDERAREGRESRLASADECAALASAAHFLRDAADEPAALSLSEEQARFADFASQLDNSVESCASMVDFAYAFLDEAFGAGKETLLFTTDISADPAAVSFINRYGCQSYFEHSEDLMLEERGAALRERACDMAKR